MGEEGKGIVWMDESLIGGREGWGVLCVDWVSFLLIVFSWVVRSVCFWRSIDRLLILCVIFLLVILVGNFFYFFKVVYFVGMFVWWCKRIGLELGGRCFCIWYFLKCFCFCWLIFSIELKVMKFMNMIFMLEFVILICSSLFMLG